MTIQRKSKFLPVLCMVMGTLMAGCNPASKETVTIAKTSDAKTSDTTTNANCCDDAEAATGCCGKCAEEQEAVTKQTGNCGDCAACAKGDSSTCKCADEAAVSTPVISEQEESGAKSDEKKSNDKVLSFGEDRDIFHFLLANHDKITRTVTELDNGVQTVTESTDPAIAAKIQTHVASMYRRVEEVRPIRMRDPLYRELFQYTDKIEMKLDNTDTGIQVTETSEDDYVVKLIQAHAKVVSGFVEHGFEEARKNHQPPKE